MNDAGTGFEVARIGEEGDGVVHPPGADGPVFVPGALPGDRVRQRADGGFDIDARPGPARRSEPLCPHFPACGGCSVQHISDAAYEPWKVSLLVGALQRHGMDPAPLVRPLVRVPLGSRRRAVLSARHEGTHVTLGFHAARSHDLVAIDACAVLRPAIVAALPALREIAALTMPRGGTCRMTVLDTGAGLDVAIARDPKSRLARLPVETIATAAAAARILRIMADGETVLLRAAPRLEIAGATVVPPPGAFVQAAAEAETAMTEIALAATTAARSRRVADLFSGLGTFAFALARRARVHAFDTERPHIDALLEATRQTMGLKPIETTVRDLFHDPLSPRELATFDAVVLDPPRAGAKAQASALARSEVATVVAVSCNPATLARDLRLLVDGGYAIEHITPVDQFLFSSHLEAVAVLRRPKRR